MLLDPVGIDQRNPRNTDTRDGLGHDATHTPQTYDPYLQTRDVLLSIGTPRIKGAPQHLPPFWWRFNQVIMIDPVIIRPYHPNFPTTFPHHLPVAFFPKPGTPITIYTDGQSQQRDTCGSGGIR